jgi:hypothetical protein
LTLNDILKTLNQNIQTALNPAVIQVYIIDMLAACLETMTTTDTETITPATNNNVWGTAQWNLTQWG